MMDVQIDQKQLQEILKSADPSFVKKEMAQLMKDAGHRGRTIAMENLKGGTEQAGYSMRFDAEPLTAKVYSVMPSHRAMSIEEGRKPGGNPPYMQIARWTTGRRYLSSRRTLSRGEQETVDRVISNIKAGGVKPKHFIKNAADSLKKELPKMLEVVASKIKGRFGK